MFGYFRFNPKFASDRIKRIYKNYYCGTCFALQHSYGEKARLLLSYDVVLLGLLAKIHNNPDAEKLPCFFQKNKKKQFREKAEWDKLATINILLVKAKIDDDRNDESSLKAKLGGAIYSRTIKRAVNKYPELAEVVDSGYKEMFRLEEQKSDVLDICNAFADMMVKLMVDAYEINEDKQRILFALARWLYFIDQLDDYDDDIKEGKFNPLVLPGIDRFTYIYKKCNVLFSYLKVLTQDFDSLKSTLDLRIPEDIIIYSLLNESMPKTMVMIINGKTLPKLNHTSKTVEWKEA